MRRGTKLFLLAGCAVILALDSRASLAAFVAGWRGPYPGRAVDVQTADAGTRDEASAPAEDRPLLARR